LKVKAENGLVRILKQEGVEWVGTFPTTVLNQACGDEGVPNFMVRTERYAVAVADGFSRVSNGKRFGVCSVMGGLNAAGLQMAYGGLAQAFEDSTPLLCVTGGIQTSIMGTKSYDITDSFRGVTKWTGYINKPHRIPEFMTRAFTHLRSGKPGPVLIQLPKGLGEYDEEEFFYTPVKGWKRMADPQDVTVAVRALLKAKNPMIYAGQGIFYADACEELRKFAELVQVPVVTTLKGKSCFSEDHPLSLGVKGSHVERWLQGSDLVFSIGSSLSPGRRYGGFAHHLPATRRSDNPGINVKVIVQCTLDELDVNRYYTVNHAVIGDAKLVLRQLIEEARKQYIPKRKKIITEISVAKRLHKEEYAQALASGETPINPYRVYNELMKVLDRRNSFVTHESGNTREQLATVYESLVPHGFMGWGRVSTLGFGLGAATGAKLAFPERDVVCVSGDAGVGYHLGDYEYLIRNHVGITIVHINNSGFAGYGPGFWGDGGNPYVADLMDSSVLNMADAAEALGMKAERVEDPDEVAPALRRALRETRSGVPAYIEIICSKYPIYGKWLIQ
jgi:acetolactate synthase-1/2/3 large subunit